MISSQRLAFLILALLSLGGTLETAETHSEASSSIVEKGDNTAAYIDQFQSKCGRVSADKLDDRGFPRTGRWPWRVNLMHREFSETWYTVCDGTLITDLHVLTTARCASDLSKYGAMRVYRVDDYDPYSTPGYGVKNVITHPDYDPITGVTDIAILTLQTPVPLGPDAAVCCLPEPKDLVGLKGAKYGWNLNWPRPQAQYIDMPIISNEDCRQARKDTRSERFRNWRITNNTICAGPPPNSRYCRVQRGECFVVYNDQQTRWFLEGVSMDTSFSIPTCYPELYTRVGNYRNWIRENAVSQ